jgi:hypothetical protein
MRPNTLFTDRVMKRLSTNPLWMMALLRHSRAMLVVLVVALLALATGSAYAIATLWQHTHVNLTPSTSTSGRRAYDVQSQCTDNSVAENTKIEVKNSMKLTDTQVASALNASCEYEAIGGWVWNTWPNDFTHLDTQTPNYVSHFVYYQLSDPSVVSSVSPGTISATTIDGTRLDKNLPSDVRVVSDGKDTNLQSIKPGSMVAIVSQFTVDEKNDSTCTPSSCTRSAENSKRTEKVVAVVGLSYEATDYTNGKGIFAMMPCDNNPVDACPHPDTETVFFRQGYETVAHANTQSTAGRLLSHDPTQFVILTSSGRKVTVHTDHDIFASFAASTRNDGFTVATGDMLEVSYGHYQHDHLATDIPSDNLLTVLLITESNQTKTKY